MGSCGFCYKCHRSILSYEESLMMGNPILLCNECEDRIAKIHTQWMNMTINEEMEE